MFLCMYVSIVVFIIAVNALSALGFTRFKRERISYDWILIGLAHRGL